MNDVPLCIPHSGSLIVFSLLSEPSLSRCNYIYGCCSNAQSYFSNILRGNPRIQMALTEEERAIVKSAENVSVRTDQAIRESLLSLWGAMWRHSPYSNCSSTRDHDHSLRPGSGRKGGRIVTNKHREVLTALTGAASLPPITRAAWCVTS
jgi:hypothetical protein